MIIVQHHILQINLTEGPSLSNRIPAAIQNFRAVGTTAALSVFEENKESEEDGILLSYLPHIIQDISKEESEVLSCLILILRISNKPSKRKR